LLIKLRWLPISISERLGMTLIRIVLKVVTMYRVYRQSVSLLFTADGVTYIAYDPTH